MLIQICRLVPNMQQLLAIWPASLADNTVCSSGLYLCSTCHLCVLEWGPLCVCKCVCVSELLHFLWSVFNCPGCARRLSPSVRVPFSKHMSCSCDRPCTFSLSVSRPHAVNLSTHLTSQPAPSGPFSSAPDDPHCGLFIHSGAFFHTLPQWLESLTDASALALLLYSLSVSTCHWALCFISSGGEQNEGY